MNKKLLNSFSGNISPDRKNFNTSSYADACSKITTSNVVETTTRGGGILLQAA
ncbi:MAG: hypothetical protein FWG85_03580 [Bacteroidetes bacterium]|nr:hypothetical protein [Bacteroidota bacterium]